MILESGKDMMNLVDHSMDLFRLEDGSYHLQAEKVDLAGIITQSVRELSPLIHRRNITIRIQMNGRPLGPADKLPFSGEQSLLKAMFRNLIKNALEASPEGQSVRINIRIVEYIEIAIHNEGIVPKAVRDRFFEKICHLRQTRRHGARRFQRFAHGQSSRRPYGNAIRSG